MHKKREDIVHMVSEAVEKRYRESPFSIPGQEVTPSTALREELEFDSLTLVVLQIEIEDLFHIRFNPATEDLRTVFQTVQTLSDGIQRHLEEVGE